MILHTLIVCVASSILWMRIGALIRNYIIKKTLGLGELEELGSKRPGGKIKGTAVVAGGSIGGLWAARFASDHFEEVVVVEPESWTLEDAGAAAHYDETGSSIEEPPLERSRVFQYSALHAFQGFTASVLKKSFSNFEMEAQKAHIPLGPGYLPAAVNGVMTSPPSEYYPFTPLPEAIHASRPGYERLLRKLTRRDCNNIRWINGSVTGIVSSTNRQSITEVSIELSGENKNVKQKATLVVDATGASSSGLKWLKDRDYGKNSRTKGDLVFDNFKVGYDPKMHYRCMDWFVPEDLRSRIPTVLGYNKTGVAFVFFPNPDYERRNTVLVKMEGHRIQAAFGGWGVAFGEMPRTLNDITAWLTSLRGLKPVEPWVITFFEMLTAANGYGPTDEMPYQDYRAPPCTHLQYHRVSDMPSNFVALGDAVMKVNPIWGHGCLKALMGALSLHSIMLHTTVRTTEKDADELPLNFSKRFFELHAPKVENIWDATKIPDYGWSTTIPSEGETLATGKFMRDFANKAVEFSHYDRELNHIMYLQRNFLVPTTDLFLPRVLVKLLFFWLTSPFYRWREPEEHRIRMPTVA